MTKEQINTYASKYKRNQRILAFIILFIIIGIDVASIAGGVLLCMNSSIPLKVLGTVLIILGLLILLIGFKFIKFIRDIKYIPNKEAAKKYCEIHGIADNE